MLLPQLPTSLGTHSCPVGNNNKFFLHNNTNHKGIQI